MYFFKNSGNLIMTMFNKFSVCFSFRISMSVCLTKFSFFRGLLSVKVWSSIKSIMILCPSVVSLLKISKMVRFTVEGAHSRVSSRQARLVSFSITLCFFLSLLSLLRGFWHRHFPMSQCWWVLLIEISFARLFCKNKENLLLDAHFVIFFKLF